MPRSSQVLELPRVKLMELDMAKPGGFPLVLAEEVQAKLAERAKQVMLSPVHTALPAHSTMALSQVAPRLVEQRQAQEDAKRRREERKAKLQALAERASAIFTCE